MSECERSDQPRDASSNRVEAVGCSVAVSVANCNVSLVGQYIAGKSEGTGLPN